MNEKNASTTAPQQLAQKADGWHALKQFTDARIALGRAGVSLPTKVQLQFNLDHACARDAVNVPLNTSEVIAELNAMGLKVLSVKSQAQDRRVYLQRPDLGRQLNEESIKILSDYATQQSASDVAIVLVDGLSSVAVQKAGAALVASIQHRCSSEGFSCTNLVLVEQGRVAIGDEIGEILSARMVVLIVGERPGLSSPDSLGIYFTFAPEKGLTDARRNCISNIRPAGLSLQEATDKTLWLMTQAQKISTSGIQLKDKSVSGIEKSSKNRQQNFLLPVD